MKESSKPKNEMNEEEGQQNKKENKPKDLRGMDYYEEIYLKNKETE